MAIDIEAHELTPLKICYSEREAAELISAPRSTLRRARLQKRIRAYRVGRAWMYCWKDLQEFVERNSSL